MSLGKVEFWTEGKRSLGSGSLVHSSGYAIVATAAHCVFDWKNKKFNEYISFYPYAHNLEFSYSPTKIVLPKIWIEQSAVEYDTAFLVFSTNAMKEFNYHDLALPVAFNLHKNLNYTVHGFPNRFWPSKKPCFNSGKAVDDSFLNSSLQGISSKNKSGMSGGPWITLHEGKAIQNSTTSLSISSSKNVLWGTYWGDTIQKAYQVASGILMNDSQVVTHKPRKGGDKNVIQPTKRKCPKVTKDGE